MTFLPQQGHQIVDGENLTSRNPSRSIGIRRLDPYVTKSNPDSVFVDQAITTFPSSASLPTCSHIISLIRLDTLPT